MDSSLKCRWLLHDQERLPPKMAQFCQSATQRPINRVVCGVDGGTSSSERCSILAALGSAFAGICICLVRRSVWLSVLREASCRVVRALGYLSAGAMSLLRCKGARRLL